jgi:hypothetical protein
MMTKLRVRIKKWFEELNSDIEIPEVLNHQINRFYLGSVGLFALTVIMLLVDPVLYTAFGFLFSLGFFVAAIYMKHKFKVQRYEVIEGTCVEIEDNMGEKVNGALASLFLLDKSRTNGGKNRKYVIEKENGQIIKIQERYKNDQIRPNKKVKVYVDVNTIAPDQTNIYSYLGVEVLLNNTIDKSETNKGM